MANKRRKSLLKRAKGYLFGGSKRFRQAKERLLKAESNAYNDRKKRKRDFRRLWITRINGALDQIGSEMNYSTFINLIAQSKKFGRLNRKSISEIAIMDIDTFQEMVTEAEKLKAKK